MLPKKFFRLRLLFLRSVDGRPRQSQRKTRPVVKCRHAARTQRRDGFTHTHARTHSRQTDKIKTRKRTKKKKKTPVCVCVKLKEKSVSSAIRKTCKNSSRKNKNKKKTQFCDTSVCECVCGLRFFCDSEESLCCSGVESTVCTSNHAWVGRVEREQQDLPGSGGGATRPGLENAPPSITREEEKKREFFFSFNSHPSHN